MNSEILASLFLLSVIVTTDAGSDRIDRFITILEQNYPFDSDVDTSTAKVMDANTLVFNVNPTDGMTIQQDPTAITAAPSSPVNNITITGGILDTDEYQFYKLILQFRNGPTNQTGKYLYLCRITILICMVFTNKKYTNLDTASIKSDGMILSCIRGNPNGNIDNKYFNNFENVLKELNGTGTQTRTTAKTVYEWFDIIDLLTDYYTCTETFTDLESDTVYNIRRIDYPLTIIPSISFSQFERNKNRTIRSTKSLVMLKRSQDVYQLSGIKKNLST